MKGILDSFISESIKDAPVSGSVPKEDAKAATIQKEVSTGSLLLSGCTDWGNSTSKAPAGLEEIHRVNVGSDVRSIYSSSSSMHEFTVLADGKVMAMGRNDHGQLGTGDLETKPLPVLIVLPSSSAVAKIATGRSHTLVLFENGEVWGCGANNFGQLGLGNGKAVSKDVLKFTRVVFPGEEQYIRDIACGHDFSLACTRQGRLFAFGHPEYGVLGQGSDGQYIKDGGKGAAVQYSCEYTPKLVDRFLTKDTHSKITATRSSGQIRIRAVAAGKNHAVCLEDWEQVEGDAEAPANRVFTWGWGGYGRLGHNYAQDEFFPREVSAFSHAIPSPTDPSVRIAVAPTNRQKQIREIVCGGSFTLAVSGSRNLYYFGKMSNAPRGEATVYPQMQQELFDYPVRRCAAGSNLIVVIAGINNRAKGINGATDGPCCAIAWGMPVSGKLGFEGNAKSTTNPKMLSRLDGLDVTAVSCGYGHVSYVAANAGSETSSSSAAAAVDALASFPVLDAVPALKSVSGGKKKAAEVEEGKGKPAAKKAKK
jgi:alpha-tubulin suppressor-like RCC1 family protein